LLEREFATIQRNYQIKSHKKKNTFEGLFFGGGILKLFASPLGLNKLGCFVSGKFFKVSKNLRVRYGALGWGAR